MNAVEFSADDRCVQEFERVRTTDKSVLLAEQHDRAKREQYGDGCSLGPIFFALSILDSEKSSEVAFFDPATPAQILTFLTLCACAKEVIHDCKALSSLTDTCAARG